MIYGTNGIKPQWEKYYGTNGIYPMVHRPNGKGMVYERFFMKVVIVKIVFSYEDENIGRFSNLHLCTFKLLVMLFMVKSNKPKMCLLWVASRHGMNSKLRQTTYIQTGKFSLGDFALATAPNKWYHRLLSCLVTYTPTENCLLGILRFGRKKRGSFYTGSKICRR